MREVTGSSVYVRERADRVANYAVYGSDLDEVEATVDELVEAQRTTCPLAGKCALSAECSAFSEASDGTSAYMGLLGSELRVEGVNVSVTDTELACPQPNAYQDVGLAVEEAY